MPNLHGLASWLGGGAATVEAVSAAAVLALLWMVCRRVRNVGAAGALAAACGVILGMHGYLQDTVLLIPLAVLVVQSQEMALWQRGWGVVLLSPLAMLLLAGRTPLAGQVLLVGFVILILAGWARAARCGKSAKQSAVLRQEVNA